MGVWDTLELRGLPELGNPWKPKSPWELGNTVGDEEALELGIPSRFGEPSRPEDPPGLGNPSGAGESLRS